MFRSLFQLQSLSARSPQEPGHGRGAYEYLLKSFAVRIKGDTGKFDPCLLMIYKGLRSILSHL